MVIEILIKAYNRNTFFLDLCHLVTCGERQINDSLSAIRYEIRRRTLFSLNTSDYNSARISYIDFNHISTVRYRIIGSEVYYIIIRENQFNDLSLIYDYSPFEAMKRWRI